MTVRAEATSTTASPLGNLTRHSDIVLAVGLMVTILMMVIPLPTVLLDLLLSFSIALGVTVLMVAIYTNEPLEFSVFPSLLLLVTLYRLALNVSSTRLILLHGDAGKIIHSFGSFVVGGNLVVGLVIFLILLVIQYIVITNGAGRVAEVAARFTLDAMPGKQMSIDADLNAGLITEEDARRRRKAIEREADFYGSMDGASKFVKGDAAAGLVIVAINIIGGFAIGMTQLGLSPGDSIQKFTLLTVGEGLVNQIPALLISTATGLIVTRAGAEEGANLGRDVTTQLLANPKVLTIVGVFLLAAALVPGLPKLPFMAIGAAATVGGFVVRGRIREQAALVVVEAQERQKEEATSVDSVVGLMQVDPLEMEIGYGLIPLVDEDGGGNLLNRITLIRRQIAIELGIVVPTIRIRDNLQLPPNTYVVKLRGIEVARGELFMNHFLAMNAGLATDPIEGITTTEPAFNLPATWITSAQRDQAEMLGYTVVDPPSVMATHLTELIRRFSPNLLSRQDTQTLFNNLKADYPAVVEELIPALLSVGEIQKVLQNLLAERISIRDLVTIAETLANYARLSRDPELLTEYVRQALARQITAQYQGEDGRVHVVTLGPRLEQALSAAIQQTDLGSNIIMEPARVQRVVQATARETERLAMAGYSSVVLCSSRVRKPFRKLTERLLPSLTILSYSELSPAIDIQSIGMVEATDED